jgi:hypothetical protein
MRKLLSFHFRNPSLYNFCVAIKLQERETKPRDVIPYSDAARSFVAEMLSQSSRASASER